MISMVDVQSIGDGLINRLHIIKNKHGIFFNGNSEKVLLISDIRKEIRVLQPSFTLKDIREVICYIDDVCDVCTLSSKYYRKSITAYGLYQKKKRGE